MIDLHNILNINDNWGILPFISIFGLKISTYSIFIFLGLIVGVMIVFFLRDKTKKTNENLVYVVFAGIIGGVLGAKIPIVILQFGEFINNPNFGIIFSGRTITGGLIGGTISVIITKKYLGLKGRLGNILVPGIIVGIAIGRIGCLLAGCCYGDITSLPWGIDFGDGLYRHPTQIYEIIYLIILLFGYFYVKNKITRQGLLFDLFLFFYFGYRFFIEFIRVEEKILYGFTLYQIISVIVIIFLMIKILFLKKFNNNGFIK